MTSGQVIIHLIFPEIIFREAAWIGLTAKEQAQAACFRFQVDAYHWMACRANLRKILSQAIDCKPREVPLLFSEYGKPELAAPYHSLNFNLSHSNNLAIVALNIDGPIGVDLEALDRAPDLLECETSFCHPEEMISLPLDKRSRADHLLQIWTAKEAVLKALGTGMSHSPKTLKIFFQGQGGVAVSNPILAGIENQRLHQLHHPALVLHQAIVSAPQSIRLIKIMESPFEKRAIND